MIVKTKIKYSTFDLEPLIWTILLIFFPKSFCNEVLESLHINKHHVHIFLLEVAFLFRIFDIPQIIFMFVGYKIDLIGFSKVCMISTTSNRKTN